jgi:hypothetical protein
MTYSGGWEMRFVVLGLPYSKQTQMKVSIRHDDQCQVDMRTQIALPTMSFWKLQEARRRLLRSPNTHKQEHTGLERFESPTGLLLLIQVVCFD